MPKIRIAAVVALSALFCSAPVAAFAAEDDTTKPVVDPATFAPVKGIHTFDISQVEANPQKTYVEIQQKDAATGKWVKTSGQWYYDTNDFAFTVDTDALAQEAETQIKVSTWDDAGNLAGRSFPVVIDRTRPLATLVSPATGGPLDSGTVQLRVDASDAHGLSKVTANIYQGTTLVKSTSSVAGGANAFTHTKAVTLPDGEYSVRYNSQDVAGNVSATGNFPFEIDTTAPTITVKPGTDTHNGYYWTAPSFSLSDAGVGQVDYVVANGTKYERSNNKWSDLNAGNYRAVEGLNTIELFDTAGNSSTFTFKLDSIAPTVVSESEVHQEKEGGRWAVTLVFSEPVSSPGQGWNGSGTTYTKVYYRAKTDSITAADAAQHPVTYTVTVTAKADSE